MKILAPSDFSPIADNAFNAACLIAQQRKAEIHIFHSTVMPDGWNKVSITEKLSTQINQAILSNAQNEYEIRSKKAAAMGVQTVFHYTEGHFLKNLKSISSEINFDLIVMGSHGTSGKKEWFIGSNTQKVIREVEKSVLVIKNPITALTFSKVLFATSLLEEDQKALKELLEFLKISKVETLHILAIETGGLFNPPKVVMLEALKDFKALASAYNCQTHFHRALSIEAGIRDFIEQHNIELIALSNHLKKPLKRILKGSNVEMVVNHVEVPVLSLDYQ